MNNNTSSSINFGGPSQQENANAKRLPRIGDRESNSKPMERFTNHIERGRGNPSSSLSSSALSQDTVQAVRWQGRAHDPVKQLSSLPAKKEHPPTSLIWAPEIDAAKKNGASGLKQKSWAAQQPNSSSIYPAGYTTPIPSDVAAMLSLHGQMVKMVFNNSNIGPRIKRFPEAKTNQDRGTMVFPFAGHSRQALFVVADGHGDKGDWASDLGARLLVSALQEDPRMADMNKSSESAIKAAFTEAFESTNAKLHAAKELRAAHASGGTTMTVVAVAGETLYSAWAGDSRTVMGSTPPGKVVALSRDHTCAIPEEWTRVDRAGGKRMVNEQTGAVRVVVPGARADEFHTLAMSRSMGDKPFHAHGVVATPEVWKFEMNCAGARPLLIVASDGVWEQVENAESIEVSLRQNQGQDAAKACKSLMDYTIEKWALNNPCYRDDITAICINLDALVRNVFGGNSSGRSDGDRRHRQA